MLYEVITFGDEAQGDEQFSDRLIRLHLLQQCDSQLILAEDAFGDQDLSDLARGGGIYRHGASRHVLCVLFLRLQFGEPASYLS